MVLPRAPADAKTATKHLHMGLQDLEDLWQNIYNQQRHRNVDEHSPIPAMA